MFGWLGVKSILFDDSCAFLSYDLVSFVIIPFFTTFVGGWVSAKKARKHHSVLSGFLVAIIILLLGLFNPITVTKEKVSIISAILSWEWLVGAFALITGGVSGSRFSVRGRCESADKNR